MTKDETLQIMATLCALYGQGKGDPGIMASAWYDLLKGYSFADVKAGVYRFARNDTRDYATFPSAGRIIQSVEDMLSERNKTVNEVYRLINYGRPYDELSEAAQQILTRSQYNAWLKIDPMSFAADGARYKKILQANQQRLLLGD